MKFICLQDNDNRAGKPSPFFKLLAMRLHSVVRIMSDESRGWKPRSLAGKMPAATV
jgi:hypothetical protein